MKKEAGIFLLLVVLCVLTALKNHLFLSPTNLHDMALQIGLFGIFSLGAGLVIITAGIDLSIGSALALEGVLLAMLLNVWHWPWPLALLVILGLGVVLGCIHGALITLLQLQPFIVTLCGLLLYRGLARVASNDATEGFGDAIGFQHFQEFVTGSVYNVPMAFILLIGLAVVLWVVVHRSVWGRHLFAVGRNENAARYSGINTRWVIASTYIVCAVLTAISSVLIAFFTNSVSPSTHGNFYELYGIAAAVLGGCSLQGGEGSVVGIVIGTALLVVLRNLVNILGIPSAFEFPVMGAVILIGVMFDQVVKMISAYRKTA